MAAIKPKILLPRTISGAHKSTIDYRKTRYNARIREAEQLGLNFRYEGKPVRQHSVRILLLKELGYRTMKNGHCAVCLQHADSCTCNIEVTSYIQH